MNLLPLNNLFNNTQNSYKYYWWLSIIEICFQKDKKEISFDEVIFKIVSKLWYSVNYYKLSFGKVDQCTKYIKQIQKNYKLKDNISETDLYQFLTEHKDSNLLVKIIDKLTRYVPYRFIRPWYSKETRGLKDGLVNTKILQLQNESAPYTINLYSNKIVINQEWLAWIKSNYNLIKTSTYFDLIKYLEKENLNVTSLSKKLEKPKSRSLSSQTKYWKSFIQKEPNQISVFENKPLVELDELSMDHFIPWSFLTHDLIWNLHPINRSTNSSKNNILPKKSYFNHFYSLQYSFCNFLLSESINKPLENYYNLFNCSNEDLKNISKEQFIKRMDSFYLPQYEVAKNMGFQYNWKLS